MREREKERGSRSLRRCSTTVGSLNLQVSFTKESYKRDYILHKRGGVCVREREIHVREFLAHFGVQHGV